jgi:rRNA processing protein Gar1
MEDEYLKYHVSVIAGFKNHEVVKCDLVYGYVSSIFGKMDETYSIVRSCKNNDNVVYNVTITVKRGIITSQKYQNS